jgi:hypothetical protein
MHNATPRAVRLTVEQHVQHDERQRFPQAEVALAEQLEISGTRGKTSKTICLAKRSAETRVSLLLMVICGTM